MRDSDRGSGGGRCRCGRHYRALLLVVLAVSVTLPAAEAVQPAGAFLTSSEIDRLKSDLPQLDLTVDRAASPQLAAFFHYYGLDSTDARHLFGTFDSPPNRLAAHVYLPPAAVGSVFLLHGFFDHSGILRHLIRRCLKEGFAVAVFDLPGHGLSSGDPGAISDFAAYVRILGDFVRICQPHLPRPYHLVGHSTGATIAIEAVGAKPARIAIFDRVVLAAPLVHHRFHRLARVQLVLIKPFTDDLPRWHRRNSSDPAFEMWLNRDPLQGRRISLRWLEALYAWNDRLRAYGPIDKPVMILQGTKDSVVDWRYNNATLQQRFTTVRMVWIEGGRHQLFNESAPIRAEVLGAVSAYLKAPDPATE